MTQAQLWINGRTTPVFAPRRFDTDLNLVFVAPGSEADRALDSWAPFSQQMRATYPHIDIYQVMSNQGRGRRPGQSGLMDLPRTLTGRRGPQELTIALLSRRGELVWQSTGGYSPEKGGDLFAAVAEAQLIFGGRIPPKKPRLTS